MVDVDRHSTLAELEPGEWPRVRWGQRSYGDPLVESCYAASKIVLKELENGAVRLLIGQQCGLLYLIPLVLERLEVDPLLEGTHYEGDLFCAVWRVEPAFWASEPSLWTRVRALSDEFWRQSKLRPHAVEFLKDKHKEDYAVFLASRPPAANLDGAS